jgi:16S rRNA (guanine527-N7)-methyltransferase
VNATDGRLTPEAARSRLERLGFTVPPDAISALCAYLAMLGKWRRVVNLVGPEDWREILEKLVVDSFHLASFLDGLPLQPDAPCLDLGAGAGLPGLPLRMVRQKGRHVLVEAREKRAMFLRAFLAVNPLPGTGVYHGWAQDCLREAEKDGGAAFILSRAFMPWEKVLDLAGPHTRSGGFCVFLSSAAFPAKLQERCGTLPQTPPGGSAGGGEKNCRTADGWTASAEASYTVDNSTRYFWALQKI